MNDTQILMLVCEGGHTQQLTLKGYSREEARDLGQIMDGTSRVYKYPPREYPSEGSVVGKCSWPVRDWSRWWLASARKPCGKWITASLL